MAIFVTEAPLQTTSWSLALTNSTGASGMEEKRGDANSVRGMVLRPANSVRRPQDPGLPRRVPPDQNLPKRGEDAPSPWREAMWRRFVWSDGFAVPREERTAGCEWKMTRIGDFSMIPRLGARRIKNRPGGKWHASTSMRDPTARHGSETKGSVKTWNGRI